MPMKTALRPSKAEDESTDSGPSSISAISPSLINASPRAATTSWPKAFAGYRLLPNVRAGLDGQLQAEYKDEKGTKSPDFTNDVNLTAGPAISWLLFQDKLQLQAVLGVSKPKGVSGLHPGGLLAASFDF